MAEAVYLVRHGQTESSRAPGLLRALDVALTEEGREQARRAAQQLADAGIDAVSRAR